MSLPTGTTWLIEREGVSDQKIEVTSTEDKSFTAKYIEIDNPSEFTGEVWERETKAINMRQYGQPTAYAAFHSGLREGADDNKYQGSWYDVAGNSGRFRLSRLM